MIAPRWRKAVADVTARPGRAVLAVIALTVGVFGLGTLAFKHAILRPVLNSMYGATRPASATLFVDSVDDALIESVRGLPGVGEAEARPVILARLRVGEGAEGEWIPAILYVVRDFDAQRLDLFRRDGGDWPPEADEILLERSGVSVARAERGSPLRLRIPGGGEQALRFAGTVHAAGLAPAWMEHLVYGFVPWNSLARAGEHRESAQLKILVAEHPLDEGHIHEVTQRVRAFVESSGRTVSRVEIPPPGRHPHADQMEAFLYLQGAFAVLAFLLGSVLVASMIHAWQAEQVREVGIMKAIGATGAQVTGIYLAEVGLLAAVSLAVGLPLAWIVGRGYAGFSARILNADVSAAPFPWTTALALAAVAVATPLLAAVAPVRRAAAITVHEALAGGKSLAVGTRRGPLALPLTRVPRPLLASLRYTLGQPARLALTVFTVALGGALFLAALNVAHGWNRAVDDDFARRRFDLLLRLATPQAVPTLDAMLRSVPEVERAEYWPGASAYLVGASGAAGAPVALLGVDPQSDLLDLKMVSGCWLSAQHANGVVINNGVTRLHPALRVGDRVALRFEGRTISFPIAGIAKEMTPQPIVYAPRAAMLSTTGRDGERAQTVRIVTRAHRDADQLAAAQAIESRLAAEGLEVAGLHRMGDMKKGILDHLVIIQSILTLAAAIVVFVGAVGIASTLTINVLQRTREIGVMSALGATPRAIAGLVWCEAQLVAALAWIGAVAMALPLTALLQRVSGSIFLRTPLDFAVSFEAVLIWLGLVVALASLAGLYPAWRAARLTVREAVTHA